MVLALISEDTIRSHQVGREIEGAHQSGKRFIPVLVDVSFERLRLLQPAWALAFGTSVSITVSRNLPPEDISRIVSGVRNHFRSLAGSVGTESTVEYLFCDEPKKQVKKNLLHSWYLLFTRICIIIYALEASSIIAIAILYYKYTDEKLSFVGNIVLKIVFSLSLMFLYWIYGRGVETTLFGVEWGQFARFVLGPFPSSKFRFAISIFWDCVMLWLPLSVEVSDQTSAYDSFTGILMMISLRLLKRSNVLFWSEYVAWIGFALALFSGNFVYTAPDYSRHIGFLYSKDSRSDYLQAPKEDVDQIIQDVFKENSVDVLEYKDGIYSGILLDNCIWVEVKDGLDQTSSKVKVVVRDSRGFGNPGLASVLWSQIKKGIKSR